MTANSTTPSLSEILSSHIEHRNRKLDRFWALGEEYIDWLFDAEEFYSETNEEDLDQ